MVFVFGFVAGIGFSLTALLTTILYVAAQMDQALDLKSALARQEIETVSIDMSRNASSGREAATLP